MIPVKTSKKMEKNKKNDQKFHKTILNLNSSGIHNHKRLLSTFLNRYTQFILNKYVFNKTEQQLKAREQNGLENAVCGSVAAFFSAITLCPTELIKCKLQALKDLGHPENM